MDLENPRFYMLYGEWHVPDKERDHLIKICGCLEELEYIMRAGHEKQIGTDLLETVELKEVHSLKKERGFFSDRIFKESLKTCDNYESRTNKEKWRVASAVGMMLGRDNANYKKIDKTSDFLLGWFQDDDGTTFKCAKKNGLLVFNIKDELDRKLLGELMYFRREDMSNPNYYALIGPTKSDEKTIERVKKIYDLLEKKKWRVRTSVQKNILLNIIGKNRVVKNSFIFSRDQLEDKTLFYWGDADGVGRKIASNFIEKFDKLSEKAKRMLEINAYKVLGPVERWKKYSKFILTWGDGEDVPTKHALAIAKKYKIPSFNVNTKGDLTKLKEFLEEE